MNLRDAVRRDISYKDPKSGKTYQLKSKVNLNTPALDVCEPWPSLWGPAGSAPWVFSSICRVRPSLMPIACDFHMKCHMKATCTGFKGCTLCKVMNATAFLEITHGNPAAPAAQASCAGTC